MSGVSVLRAVRSVQPASPERLGTQTRARNTLRYRLRDAAGWLHMGDFSRRAADPIYGWIGFRGHLEALLARHPGLAMLEVVEVAPDKTAAMGDPGHKLRRWQ
jgi:hypothetical protein